MPFEGIGQQQTQFGVNLAELRTRAALQERQMREVALENFKNQMLQMYKIKEEKKQARKERRKGYATAGIGAGASLLSLGILAPYLAPAAVAPAAVAGAPAGGAVATGIGSGLPSIGLGTGILLPAAESAGTSAFPLLGAAGLTAGSLYSPYVR